MSLSFRFGSVGAVQQIRALGMGAFEIAWVRAVRVSEEPCAEIKAATEQEDEELCG